MKQFHNPNKVNLVIYKCMLYSLIKIFNEHPKSLNETYGEHLLGALVFSVTFFACSIIVTIHAVFPFIFKTTATDLLIRVIKRNRPDLFEKNTKG
jgi:hypothetical protein